MTGTIKRLIKDKGFGFIQGSDKLEYFFHSSGVKNSDFDTLQEGQAVSFERTEGKKGPRAEEVMV